MPTGIWIRTEKQMEQIRELGKRPKTPIQVESGRKVGLSNKGRKGRPRTQEQIKVARKNAKQASEISASLPRTKKQLEACRKHGHEMGSSNTADMIIEHHNDLCHGEERPDDVIYMTHREHSRLHANLRVKNRTHNFLIKHKPPDG